nr:Flp family type IVb pilin [uncultured Lichenicoccus sp.]
MIDYVRTYLRLKHDERAVTALEYALIAGLIAVVIITAVTTLGTTLKGVFNTVSTGINDA